MSRKGETFERYRPHPWHGVATGSRAPHWVNVYVEITPFDQIKYELDPRYGFLRVDRPQKNATLPPALYGLIPQTLCGPKVAAFNEKAEEGDGDALDVCVLSEHDIRHPEVLLTGRVIGGIRTTDEGRADEKIVTVLENDFAWGEMEDISELPRFLMDRLMHYFTAYKQEPGRDNRVEVIGSYDAAQARRVVKASMDDYRNSFG